MNPFCDIAFPIAIVVCVKEPLNYWMLILLY